MKSILFAAILFCLGVSPALSQAVVRLESSGEVGHGLAVAQSGDCFIVTPKHVVGDAFEARVMTPSRGAADLELVQVSEVVVTLPSGEEVREDLALLRASAHPRDVCSDNLQSFENERRSFVATTDGKGDVMLTRIDVLGAPNKTVSFQFGEAGRGQAKSMSGAPLMWGGKLAGLVVRLSTDGEESEQVAYDIQLVARHFGAWVAGEELEVAAVDQALSVLERVREMLPASDIGQVAALKELTKGGASLAGLDLKGFYFDRARLDELDFSGSDFRGASFNQATMRNARLKGAIFNFSISVGVQMQGADASASHNEYVNYDDGAFAGANFSRANLLYASFRGADLSDVDFTNANLVYADMTGANIAGTDFTGALLNGATLQDVSGLESAVFKNTSVTNMAGAPSRRFTDDEICGHVIGEKGYDHATIIEKVPSARFDDGFKYDNLLEYTEVSSYEFTPASMIGMAHYHFLRQCPTPAEEVQAAGTRYHTDAHRRFSSISVANKQFFHRDFLSKRGLRKYIPSRMVERTKQTISSNATRDFVLPETSRDSKVAAYFRRQTENISDRKTTCLGSDLFTTRQMIAFDENAPRRDELLLDEIVETIRNSTARESALNEVRASKNLEIDRGAAFPFGAAHLPGAEVPKYGFGPHLNLGASAIDAYEEWKAAVTSHSDFALCITSAELGRDAFPALYVVNDYETGGAWVTAARKAIGNLDRKPQFSGNLGFLKGYSHAIAFFLDETPPEFRSDDKVNYHSISRSLPQTEQLQIRIGIDRVTYLEDDRLILVFGRYKGSTRVSVAAAPTGAGHAGAVEGDADGSGRRRRK